MPGKHRAHTPIVSRQQQKLFGYWQSNPSKRPSSITAAEVEAHLQESEGKKLPKRTKKRDYSAGHHDVQFDHRKG